jgi:hypothetical protein
MTRLHLRTTRIDDASALALDATEAPISEGEIPLAAPWRALRELALRAVVAGLDVHALAKSLPTAGDSELRCRVVLPPHVVAQLRDGTSRWRQAGDRSGTLPWVTDASGKIRHQVRLDNFDSVAHTAAPLASLAAQQAATHAMLQDLAAQLCAIDAKVDDLLQNHKFRWWSDIEAGIELFLEVPQGRLGDPRVSEARQLITRGVTEGWRHIDRAVDRIAAFKPVTIWSLVQRAAGGSNGLDASDRRSIIDEFHADLPKVLHGTQALVRLYEHLGESELARSKAERLRRRFAELSERVGTGYRLAPSTGEQHRADDAIFLELLPSLCTPTTTPAIVVDTHLDELLALEAPRAEPSPEDLP